MVCIICGPTKSRRLFNVPKEVNAGNASQQMLDNVITVNNASMTSQQQKQKVDDYYSQHGRGIAAGKMMPTENADKLKTMWMYTAKHAGGHHHHHHHKAPGVTQVAAARPIMLVPAGNGVLPPLGFRHPSAVMLTPGMMPGSMSLPYGGVPVPVLPTNGTLHPEDMKALYRMRTSQKPISEIGKYYLQHQTQQRRTGKNEASRRQRRRSESDAETRRAFTYTGLDRTIADDFLKQQEQSNNGSNAGYSSGESMKDGDQDVRV